MVASQSAWAPWPPEKKLSVGGGPLLSASVVGAARKGTARNTAAATANGHIVRFACIMSSFLRSKTTIEFGAPLVQMPCPAMGRQGECECLTGQPATYEEDARKELARRCRRDLESPIVGRRPEVCWRLVLRHCAA